MKLLKFFIREIFYFIRSLFIINKNYYFKQSFKNGLVVVKDFLSDNECENLILEIENMLENKNNLIIHDDIKSDFRIYGIDNISHKFNSIINKKVKNFVNNNLGWMINLNFIMGAKTVFKENNIGSGQGWHRDSEEKDQFKCMIYLENVTENNGPFQYILKTHKPLSFIYLFLKNKINYKQYRISENEINKIISSKFKCNTITAPKGTAIFFNSRGIHRGKPLINGKRYASTNYIFDKEIPNHLKKILNE